MRRRINFTACSLLLLTLAGFFSHVDALWKDYGKVLENLNMEEKLMLLGPKSLLKYRKNIVDKVNVNENETAISYACVRDLAIVDEALVRREIWALKMLDASSKIPSGILEGNIIDLGMYDECVAVNGRFLGVEIHGRHCMYSLSGSHDNVSLPLNPTVSICVSSSCTADDILTLINGTINVLDKLKDFGIKVSSVNCAGVDKKLWSTEFIVCFSILIAYIAFLAICNLCDVIKNRDGYQYPLLRALGNFSPQKSITSIFSTKTREDNLPALHGIRFLSMAWIVLGHQYVFQFFGVNVNNLDVYQWIQSWKSLYIFIAPFAVDTFFTLSGFLTTYVFLKQMPKQRTFNLAMYYLHRYFRLTPAVIALIVITVVFVPKIGSGPLWDTIMQNATDNCRITWWTNLLYIQNFVDTDQMCLGHLWYLAVDMQLFWISPIILYPLYKKPKIGLMIYTILFGASLVVPATIIAINKYRTMSFTHETDLTKTLDVFKRVYIMPYNRAAPWLVGILYGYDVATKNRNLSKPMICSGWLLTIGSLAFCTFGTRSFMSPYYEYDLVWETFFSTVSRPIWAFAVCWIIYASIYSCAGPISSILSWKFFMPLSRLSYCVYLVHIVIQSMQVAALRTSKYFSDYYTWHIYLSDLAISLTVALFFSLLFESPVLVLEKMLFRRKRVTHYESQRELVRPNDEEDDK